MTTVNVAELKNNLSSYLQRVRSGEELLVRDRNVPIAKIIPLQSAGEFDQELLSLAAAGLVRLPEKRVPARQFRPPRGRRVPLQRLVNAVTADREEA